jgi:Tol biopolymer transport system component
MGTFSFDFSPDSKQLVVSANRDKKAMVRPWKDELLRVDVASGKVTPIPNLPKGPKTHARWSPDGRTIAFAGREGTDGIYSVENLQVYVADPVKGQARSPTARDSFSSWE